MRAAALAARFRLEAIPLLVLASSGFQAADGLALGLLCGLLLIAAARADRFGLIWLRRRELARRDARA